MIVVCTAAVYPVGVLCDLVRRVPVPVAVCAAAAAAVLAADRALTRWPRLAYRGDERLNEEAQRDPEFMRISDYGGGNPS